MYLAEDILTHAIEQRKSLVLYKLAGPAASGIKTGFQTLKPFIHLLLIYKFHLVVLKFTKLFVLRSGEALHDNGALL